MHYYLLNDTPVRLRDSGPEMLRDGCWVKQDSFKPESAQPVAAAQFDLFVRKSLFNHVQKTFGVWDKTEHPTRNGKFVAVGDVDASGQPLDRPKLIGRALAVFYADLFNVLTQSGSPPSPEQTKAVNDDLAGSSWLVAQHEDDHRWTAFQEQGPLQSPDPNLEKPNAEAPEAEKTPPEFHSKALFRYWMKGLGSGTSVKDPEFERLHPRGKGGHWVSKGEMEAAAADPAKAKQLRDSIPKEDDKQKLDAYLQKSPKEQGEHNDKVGKMEESGQVKAQPVTPEMAAQNRPPTTEQSKKEGSEKAEMKVGEVAGHAQAAIDAMDGNTPGGAIIKNQMQQSVDKLKELGNKLRELEPEFTEEDVAGMDEKELAANIRTREGAPAQPKEAAAVESSDIDSGLPSWLPPSTRHAYERAESLEQRLFAAGGADRDILDPLVHSGALRKAGLSHNEVLRYLHNKYKEYKNYVEHGALDLNRPQDRERAEKGMSSPRNKIKEYVEGLRKIGKDKEADFYEKVGGKLADEAYRDVMGEKAQAPEASPVPSPQPPPPGPTSGPEHLQVDESGGDDSPPVITEAPQSAPNDTQSAPEAPQSAPPTQQPPPPAETPAHVIPEHGQLAQNLDKEAKKAGVNRDHIKGVAESMAKLSGKPVSEHDIDAAGAWVTARRKETKNRITQQRGGKPLDAFQEWQIVPKSPEANAVQEQAKAHGVNPEAVHDVAEWLAKENNGTLDRSHIEEATQFLKESQASKVSQGAQGQAGTKKGAAAGPRTLNAGGGKWVEQPDGTWRSTSGGVMKAAIGGQLYEQFHGTPEEQAAPDKLAAAVGEKAPEKPAEAEPPDKPQTGKIVPDKPPSEMTPEEATSALDAQLAKNPNAQDSGLGKESPSGDNYDVGEQADREAEARSKEPEAAEQPQPDAKPTPEDYQMLEDADRAFKERVRGAEEKETRQAEAIPLDKLEQTQPGQTSNKRPSSASLHASAAKMDWHAFEKGALKTVQRRLGVGGQEAARILQEAAKKGGHNDLRALWEAAQTSRSETERFGRSGLQAGAPLPREREQAGPPDTTGLREHIHDADPYPHRDLGQPQDAAMIPMDQEAVDEKLRAALTNKEGTTLEETDNELTRQDPDTKAERERLIAEQQGLDTSSPRWGEIQGRLKELSSLDAERLSAPKEGNYEDTDHPPLSKNAADKLRDLVNGAASTPKAPAPPDEAASKVPLDAGRRGPLEEMHAARLENQRSRFQGDALARHDAIMRQGGHLGDKAERLARVAGEQPDFESAKAAAEKEALIDPDFARQESSESAFNRKLLEQVFGAKENKVPEPELKAPDDGAKTVEEAKQDSDSPPALEAPGEAAQSAERQQGEPLVQAPEQAPEQAPDEPKPEDKETPLTKEQKREQVRKELAERQQQREAKAKAETEEIAKAKQVKEEAKAAALKEKESQKQAKEHARQEKVKTQEEERKAKEDANAAKAKEKREHPTNIAKGVKEAIRNGAVKTQGELRQAAEQAAGRSLTADELDKVGNALGFGNGWKDLIGRTGSPKEWERYQADVKAGKIKQNLTLEQRAERAKRLEAGKSSKTLHSVIRRMGGLSRENGEILFGKEGVRSMLETTPTLFQNHEGKPGRLDIEEVAAEMERTGQMQVPKGVHPTDRLIEQIHNRAQWQDQNIQDHLAREREQYEREQEDDRLAAEREGTSAEDAQGDAGGAPGAGAADSEVGERQPPAEVVHDDAERDLDEAEGVEAEDTAENADEDFDFGHNAESGSETAEQAEPAVGRQKDKATLDQEDAEGKLSAKIVDLNDPKAFAAAVHEAARAVPEAKSPSAHETTGEAAHFIEIAKQVAAGNTKNKEELFAKLHPKLLEAVRGTVSKDDEGDAAQDAALNIWRNLTEGKYDGKDNFLHWAITVGRNAGHDATRKEQRHTRGNKKVSRKQGVNLGGDPEQGGFDPQRSEIPPDKQLRVQELMAKLNPEDRAIVERLQQGQSFKDIAAAKDARIGMGHHGAISRRAKEIFERFQDFIKALPDAYVMKLFNLTRVELADARFQHQMKVGRQTIADPCLKLALLLS